MQEFSGDGAYERAEDSLSGLVVLDVSTDIAGRFCARLMADNGADVTLVESKPETDLRRSALWRHLNAGKLLADWDAGDRELLAKEAKGCDIVICGASWQVDTCRQVDDRVVAVLVTPFGTSGPYADWQGSEMIYQAMSGSMPNNGLAGRQPLYGCCERASYAAGVAAYCGALGALYEREASGLGQLVDVAIAEVAAAMTIGTVAVGHSGKAPQNRGTAQSMVRCSGEWVLLWCYPFQWRDFCIAVEALDLYEDTRFADQSDRNRNWPALLEILQSRLGCQPADAVVARLRARKLITAKAEMPSGMGRHPHLAARSFWREYQGQRILGPLFRAYRSPQGSERKTSKVPAAKNTALPLAGLRMLDLTTAWAGPMAARILAFLGADVVHLEHATKPDLWRHHRQVYSQALYVRGDDPVTRYNRNALFNSQNINKRSLSLDLKSPEGAEIGQQIAAGCDVVLTNFTPGTLDRLGLGYETLSKKNPAIIVCEMPAFGLAGPDSRSLAVGATMEMATTMSSMVGYGDGTPTTTGPNLPDPIGGLNAAAAILTALVGRRRHGGGQLLEVAQVEAALHYVGAELLEAIETGVDPVPQGNRLPNTAPHDAFPTVGEDQWVAIAVLDESGWQRLCDLIDPDLRDDPKFSELQERLLHQDDLYQIIAAWTSTRNKVDVAAALQAVGIAAAPVLDPADLLADPFFTERGAFSQLPHPEVGVRPYHTVPIRLSRTPGEDRTAGPCLGQHTDAVLAEFGIEAERRAQLAAHGVTANIAT
jgi:crotonobetainyl-CoA:carnitine CoA-transferase CaiB-like acyl-CoA transferase